MTDHPAKLKVGLVRRLHTSGVVRWYLYDGLGSVLMEVDPNENVTASRKYDVYGSVRSGDAGISKQKFVGQLGHPSEDETGLIYMQARYMDPVLGRFISQDPACHGTNWLSYCCSNPVNLRDPDGQNPRTLEGVMLMVAGLSYAAVLMASSLVLGETVGGRIVVQILIGVGLFFGAALALGNADILSMPEQWTLAVINSVLLTLAAVVAQIESIGKLENFFMATSLAAGAIATNFVLVGGTIASIGADASG